MSNTVINIDQRAEKSSKNITCNPQGIPQALRERAQWVLWRLEHNKDDKLTKVPYNARNGKWASSTNKDTWATYEAVCFAYESSTIYDGIGFVFTDSDPFTVLDLDHCISEGGNISHTAQRVLDRFDTYSESSQSGHGIHVVLIGSPPGTNCKHNQRGVEIYRKGRFVALTGNRVTGTPAEVNERQQVLNDLYYKLWPQEKNKPTQPATSHQADTRPNNLADIELMNCAYASIKGDTIKRLMSGDELQLRTVASVKGDGNVDRSSADQALCNHLAFWLGGDIERIDRVFRASGLMRDKWDRDDYRQSTMVKAVEACNGKFYSPPTNGYQPTNEELTLLDSYADVKVEDAGDGTLAGGEHVEPHEAPETPQTHTNEPGPDKTADREPYEPKGEKGEPQSVATSLTRDVEYVRNSLVDQDGLPLVNGKVDPFKFDRVAETVLIDLCERGTYPLAHNQTLYLWDGTRYVEYPDHNNLIRDCFRRHAIGQSNNVVGNVSPIVFNMANRPKEKYGEMPFHFGPGDFPNPQRVIAYTNGLLDLDEYHAGRVSLRAHTPCWASTTCLPYAFDPTAKCPQWMAFLNQVFEGDQERINLLQEWCGYLLTYDISQHKLMILVGVPRAGKGTTQHVIEYLVGSDNCTGYSLHSLADKFGLGRLANKLVAFVGEVHLAGCPGKYRILEVLNSVVGGDPVSIEQKNKNLCVSATLPTRFMLACNELPNFNDPTGALSARLLVLPYNQSFEGKEDRGLQERLLTEVAGINTWALEGYKRLRANKRFCEPKISTDIIKSFRRESSDMYGFIQDCLLVERKLNPGNLSDLVYTDTRCTIDKQLIDAAFTTWAAENKCESHLKWLGRNLKSILPASTYDHHKRRYYGLALNGETMEIYTNDYKEQLVRFRRRPRG